MKSASVLAIPKSARRPAPPPHLTPATRRWWRDVTGTFVLESWHLRLLAIAAFAWDQMQEARALLRRDGLLLGEKAHPGLKVERDAAVRFQRALRELQLDIEPPASEDRRPPAFRGGRIHA